ncbi:MAG: hypothetical protein WC069_01715 [Candidatus Shapirobacteria bacterium]
MSSTVFAPYEKLGPNGNYPIEMNFGLRFYPPNDPVPEVGHIGASLKGGQRTNFIGLVPILVSNADNTGLDVVGQAEITRIQSARPENMPIEDIIACGFKTTDEAIIFVQEQHKDEFERDGVLTIYHYRINNLNSL